MVGPTRILYLLEGGTDLHHLLSWDVMLFLIRDVG